MALTTIVLLAFGSFVCLISAEDDLVTELERLKELLVSLEERINRTQQQQNVETLQINNLTSQTEARFSSLNGQLEQQINLLESKERDLVDPKVAFSASLAESDGVFVGPSTTNSITLVFQTVFINTGDAFNRITGIFTTPVKGAYHFTIATFGYNTYTSGAILVKNDKLQVSTYEFQGPDSSDSTSNTVILPLDVGDQVKIILWTNGQVYDNANHHTTFSGFLLFKL